MTNVQKKINLQNVQPEKEEKIYKILPNLLRIKLPICEKKMFIVQTIEFLNTCDTQHTQCVLCTLIPLNC